VPRPLLFNADAEQFYLKGRFYWQKRTPDGLNKAVDYFTQGVDYFTQAIVRDPDYAPAYVGLAHCYNLLREYTVMPASEAYPRALAAAKKVSNSRISPPKRMLPWHLLCSTARGTRLEPIGNFAAPSI
jgi:hypothetical protein